MVARSHRSFTVPNAVGYPAPIYRRIKVFAFDPMLGRSPLHRIVLNVPYEPLKPGPTGSRIQIIDFDGVNQTYYDPVNLDDGRLLLQDGLDPSESDPHFHQQMVYAVAMKVLENFDAALGRRLYFDGRRPLCIFPHAFAGANAFYDPRRGAVLFGYFPASKSNFGANLPGQPIFSCLSHDIITHEVTHAITHRLRDHFLEPTNGDVLAFHEAFSDIVAIFQHFSFPEILRNAIQETQGGLRDNTDLVDLAQQFGYATGQRGALRSAVDEPDPVRFALTVEPHERGSVLVGAVFAGFLRTYQARIQDLLRIASGGTGQLPQGAIHPDLANRMADEATSVANSTLRMCIRAFDYLPPVDVTFGDYLRALVTADFELNPSDTLGLRRAIVEACRERGIHPDDVNSLSEDELRWMRVDPVNQTAQSERDLLTIINAMSVELIQEAALTSRNSVLDDLTSGAVPRGADISSQYGGKLRSWAESNAALLHLSSEEAIQPEGFHTVFRVGRDGMLLMELVLQFTQTRKQTEYDFGGVPLRGGSTIIVQANGKIRYVISKPLVSSTLCAPENARAKRRLERQAAYLNSADERDSLHIWKDQRFQQERLSRMANLAGLHGMALR
jgi:hypothetical protein